MYFVSKAEACAGVLKVRMPGVCGRAEGRGIRWHGIGRFARRRVLELPELGGREGCAGSAGWEGCEPGPSWFDGRSLRSLLTMGASGIVLAKTSQRQHFRGAGEREA
jgi:hypothetical protein